ncbi:MAG: hypothetical protein A2991_02060 [Candidatus Terrybacteria bacterium RIFCSPLOWO2_01_FULL_58_14]|nr:MAG: hypothetical protein A2991_02060 [Candidatus Terrybacteria bacterium RIFCSPLOWO2_01_FULL_58_14]
MALTKVFGTETEYGISLPNSDRLSANAMELVQLARETLAVPSMENPQNRERLDLLLKHEGSRSRSQIDSFLDRLRLRGRRRRNQRQGEEQEELFRIVGLSGSMLPNGARFYVDMGHPEYSTPECTSARELVAWYRAGDLLVDAGRRALEEKMQVTVEVHKDNSDRAGHSYAAHENYCVDPGTFEELITPSPKSRILETFFVTRQIVVGAGKVGCEEEHDNRRSSLRWLDDEEYGDHPAHCPYPYQLSQRADFINARLGEDTTYRRGIINTRDRPYADATRFRRLHVIVGDANICDVAFWLKIGLTAMVLKMLEDDFPASVGSPLCTPLHDGVAAIRAISHDPTLTVPVSLQDGRHVTALDIQREFHALLARYFADAAVPTKEERDLLDEFSRVLDFLGDLPNHRDDLVGTLDWATKQVLLEELCERGFSWDDPRMRVRDARYHDVNPAVGLRQWLDDNGYLRRLASDEEIARALVTPPESTRAYLRGRCIAEFSSALRGAQWEYLFFDAGDAQEHSSDTEEVIALSDPLRGNADEVREALDTAKNPVQLLRFLKEAGITVRQGSRW